MFTGIVTERGKVVALDRGGTDARISIHAPGSAGEARLGDSISVNGICLTVAVTDDETFTADVMPETLARSTLGTLDVGDLVNLELALTASSRLGGHIVQGHVDGVGTITSREPGARWDTVRISLPGELAKYVVEKGSIAVDGVSLTVTEVGDEHFAVGLIPTTLAETTLGYRDVGDRVNLEVDVIAKHVARLVESREGSS